MLPLRWPSNVRIRGSQSISKSQIQKMMIELKSEVKTRFKVAIMYIYLDIVSDELFVLTFIETVTTSVLK